jgi:hypothetical protein
VDLGGHIYVYMGNVSSVASEICSSPLHACRRTEDGKLLPGMPSGHVMPLGGKFGLDLEMVIPCQFWRSKD